MRILINKYCVPLFFSTREDLLGDLFYSGTLGYFAQLTALATLAGVQLGGHFQLAAGHGTIGYEPNVDTFFGIPRSIQPGSVVFDIPIIQITQTNDGNREQLKQYNLQVGVLSSALEHTTPEQMFDADSSNPPDAISAVKALAKASAAGQRIYQITQANQSSILPNINHDLATMNEIRVSLNMGKTVITHTDAVSILGGWSGAGYIILDPETNVGAWKIGGGLNGSVIDALNNFLYMIAAVTGFADGRSDVLKNRVSLMFRDLSENTKAAERLSNQSKVLGSLGLLLAIILAAVDQRISGFDKLGQASTAVLGFGITAKIGALVAGSIGFPIVAAIAITVISVSIALLMVEFNSIYFSKLFFMNPRRTFFAIVNFKYWKA